MDKIYIAYENRKKGLMRSSYQTLSAIIATVSCYVSIEVAFADPVSIEVALPNFASGGGESLNFKGVAAISGADLHLTSAAGSLYGAAFNRDLVSLSSQRSFSTYFTFRMTNPQCGTGEGADGLAFVIQADESSVGSSGGGIGYEGIPSSLAIEFDSFKNEGFSDPDNNHIGISLNGNPKSVATVEAPFLLINENTYHAWVDYDGRADLLEVRLMDSAARPSVATLSYKTDLEAIFGSEVFVGFTAATGSCFEQHYISSFYFSRDLLAGGIDTTLNEYLPAHG